MKIRLEAPEGYKYQDSMTGRLYSVVIVDKNKQSRFELVPDKTNYSKN